ncbi:unnamed protein product [Somion occarium]|uniref:Uncharacterized protein n=1 Tax=Somion occarium TaxID=3059160 RepID=A0ABP1DRS5_9APHY
MAEAESSNSPQTLQDERRVREILLPASAMESQQQVDDNLERATEPPDSRESSFDDSCMSFTSDNLGFTFTPLAQLKDYDEHQWPDVVHGHSADPGHESMHSNGGSVIDDEGADRSSRFTAAEKGKGRAISKDRLDDVHPNESSEAPKTQHRSTSKKRARTSSSEDDPAPHNDAESVNWETHIKDSILRYINNKEDSFPLGRRVDSTLTFPSQFLTGFFQLAAIRDPPGSPSRIDKPEHKLDNYVEVANWARSFLHMQFRLEDNQIEDNVIVLLMMLVNDFYDTHMRLADAIVTQAIKYRDEDRRDVLKVEDFVHIFERIQNARHDRIYDALEARRARAPRHPTHIPDATTRSGRTSRLTPQAQAALRQEQEKERKKEARKLKKQQDQVRKNNEDMDSQGLDDNSPSLATGQVCPTCHRLVPGEQNDMAISPKSRKKPARKRGKKAAPLRTRVPKVSESPAPLLSVSTAVAEEEEESSDGEPNDSAQSGRRPVLKVKIPTKRDTVKAESPQPGPSVISTIPLRAPVPIRPRPSDSLDPNYHYPDIPPGYTGSANNAATLLPIRHGGLPSTSSPFSQRNWNPGEPSRPNLGATHFPISGQSPYLAIPTSNAFPASGIPYAPPLPDINYPPRRRSNSSSEARTHDSQVHGHRRGLSHDLGLSHNLGIFMDGGPRIAISSALPIGDPSYGHALLSAVGTQTGSQGGLQQAGPALPTQTQDLPRNGLPQDLPGPAQFVFRNTTPETYLNARTQPRPGPSTSTSHTAHPHQTFPTPNANPTTTLPQPPPLGTPSFPSTPYSAITPTAYSASPAPTITTVNRDYTVSPTLSADEGRFGLEVKREQVECHWERARARARGRGG